MFSVLIDTSAYEAQRLSFRGEIFDSLIKLSKEQKITIVGSDLLRKEMEAHLQESLSQSINKVDKVSKELDRLTREDLIEFIGLARGLPELKQDLFIKRKDRIDDFFSEVNYEELDLTQVDLRKVIEDYFGMVPPFGEGNKRKEFPDAFVLHAFLEMYNENLQYTCVVSTDPDWKKFADQHPGIHFFNTIPEVIDFIHADYDKSATLLLKEALTKNIEEVREWIADEIKDSSFTVDDSWIDSEEELDTESVEVEVSGFNIISYNGENAKVQAEAKVSFKLRVWAADESACYKDYDTKEWIYLGTNQYSVTVRKRITVDMDISYDPHPVAIADSIELGELELPEELFYIESDEYKFELVKHWNEDDWES